MKYATLLHGVASEVIEELDCGEVDLQGLGMAVSNAFLRIERLEKEAIARARRPWPPDAEDRVYALMAQVAEKELECQRLREQLRGGAA